ncbi:MAG TPA: hypothetical protein VJN90_08735, partial [Candidatus Acidoferrales bacterium]|nr:hypothetical protein [Candidatus Acidoferrales bacterium]
MRQTLRAFFAIAILLTGAAAILALLIATQPAQSLPTLDLYGGRTDIACANSTGHFILEKVGARWWFCTPLGHVYVSMSVTTNAPNSSPTYDCLRTPAGATSGVTWTSGSATYTFASVPAIAIVGSGLVTTGFTPSGYNLTDAKITAVGTDSVTFAMTANPGAATVLGTGAFDGDASTVYVAKYGDAGFNWGWQTLKRAKSWKFNSIGQDSHVDTYATRTCSGCVWPGGVQPLPVPNIIEFK